MKKKNIASLFTMLLLSLSITLISQTAHASECSLQDPCESWAMLDDTGKVINVIVCQPSVCGGGVWDNHRVVRQTAANPTTNATNSVMTYNSTDKVTVTYNDSNKTFQVADNTPVQKQETIISNTSQTTLTTIIEKKPVVSFTYEDTKTDPTKQITNGEYSNDTNASVSITKKLENSSEETSSTFEFEERTTEEDAISQINNKLSIDPSLQLLLDFFQNWSLMFGHWFL